MSDVDLAPNAPRFPELPPDRLAVWSKFPQHVEQPAFPKLLGFQLEELREGYARLRMPWKQELDQPQGVVHGGALASLIDTVVVPAIGAQRPEPVLMLTLQMSVQYLAAVIRADAVAEGWVVRRGRSTAFCRAEVRSAATGEVAATGELVYSLKPAKPAS